MSAWSRDPLKKIKRKSGQHLGVMKMKKKIITGESRDF